MVAQPGVNRFELRLPPDSKEHPVFHVSRLKIWNDPDVPKRPRLKLPKGFGELEEFEHTHSYPSKRVPTLTLLLVFFVLCI